MPLDLLNRNEAPFDTALWSMLDNAVREIAGKMLSARKLLYAEGPYGLGAQFITGLEERSQAESTDSLTVSISRAMPLALVATRFSIAARDLDAAAASGQRLSLKPLVDAILMCAAKEDALIYYGSRDLAINGLLNSPGVQSMKLNPWKEPGNAVESIIAAANRLDASGFPGPYSLALSTPLYNMLLRRYPQSDILEIDHLKTLVTDGIVKSPHLQVGGVLVASGKEFASVVLGQDLVAGFEGPSGRDYVFVLSESIGLRLVVPSTVCVLEASG